MATQTVTSTDGTTIAFETTGTGPALILVGGAFQHRAFDPRTGEIATRLGDHFTTYHYDRRGRGESTDTAPYAIDRELDDLAALIEHAGGSARVFGHSSGAVLALDTAAAGLPITRLAVYEPPIIVDDTRPDRAGDIRERLLALLAEDRRGDAVEVFMVDAVGVPAGMVAGMRQAPIWAGFEEVAHTLPYDVAITDRADPHGQPVGTQWTAIDVPVLVLDGGASPAWMRNAAVAIGAALPTATHQTVPGQDHGPTSEALAPVLLDFFR